MSTETSDLTSDASLTRLQAEPDLPGSHTPRYTATGFLVGNDKRLNGYVPTPPRKWPSRSWVWNKGVGEAITKASTSKEYHLCRICWDNKQQSLFTVTSTHTTQIQRHMASHGYDKDGNLLKKRQYENDEIDGMFKRQKNAQDSTFNREAWQSLFIAYLVSDDVSLRKTTSPAFHELLAFRNPILEPVLPKSIATTRKWLIKSYQGSKNAVRNDLAQSKSRITLSFDSWKSNNELDFLGVVAHYINKDYCMKNVLLALRNTFGSHTAQEQQHHLLAVCRDFRISNRIAYFMADNASNNDKTLELLSKEIDFKPEQSRLRCAGHIINLVTKAILYGTDVDCVDEVLSASNDSLFDSGVSKFEAALRSQDPAEVLKAWRRKGPVGKLHNLVLHVRSSPLRRSFFERKQKEADAEAPRLYQLVVNGGIRWNSTCDMIERAIKLRDALDLYQQAFKDNAEESVAQDALTNNDWQELVELLALLKPLKQTSLFVQGNGDSECRHGSLFENLQALDFLLTKLEGLKKRYAFGPATHFKASINLGWKKLNKYYELSDCTAAYRASILIHPHFKMRWFEEHWGDKEHWIRDCKEAIAALYQEYKRRHGDDAVALTSTATAEELSEFDQYNTLCDEAAVSDELTRYLREERQPKHVDPLRWWQLNEERYPILRQMAFDHLAAPASSSADERQFSMAGNMLDDEHYHSKDDLAQAQQCVKSWRASGIRLTLYTEPEEHSSSASTPSPTPRTTEEQKEQILIE